MNVTFCINEVICEGEGIFDEFVYRILSNVGKVWTGFETIKFKIPHSELPILFPNELDNTASGFCPVWDNS
jgi:hypothetical protein